MRAFVQLRRVLQSHAELAQKIEKLESKYDGQFRVVFDAIRGLMQPPVRARRQIGFRSPSAVPRERSGRRQRAPNSSITS
jgi:hypothetical protein